MLAYPVSTNGYRFKIYHEHLVEGWSSHRVVNGNRGHHALSDRKLCLIYDNGKVEELLSSPWDTTHKNIVINGTTYSRK